MRKQIYLSFIFVIIAMAIMSCADKMDNDLNQTGLLDQNGNLIKDTLVYTNRMSYIGSIPIWATNLKFYYLIETNYTTFWETNFNITYGTNYYLPSYPERPTDYYKVRLPFAKNGSDYVTVSYRDVAAISKLWLEQIFRKGAVDGNVFAIRNRDNNGGFWYEKTTFQSERDGRFDYYYFDDNGDIYYKGGDKDNKESEILIKKYIGAVIVDYRKKHEREYTGEWTIGGIYKMAMDVNTARDRFKGEGAIEGVYDFIAARDNSHSAPNFLRQYYNTDFLEVLVLNPYNNENNLNCLGVDAYYAYYAEVSRANHVEGAYPIKGFTEKNIPYMTDEYAYLGQRPEWISMTLNSSAYFTDGDRGWKFLAMPGNSR